MRRLLSDSLALQHGVRYIYTVGKCESRFVLPLNVASFVAIEDFVVGTIQIEFRKSFSMRSRTLARLFQAISVFEVFACGYSREKGAFQTALAE